MKQKILVKLSQTFRGGLIFTSLKRSQRLVKGHFISTILVEYKSHKFSSLADKCSYMLSVWCAEKTDSSSLPIFGKLNSPSAGIIC